MRSQRKEYVLRLDGVLKMHWIWNKSYTYLQIVKKKCISKVILSEKLYEFLAWNTVAFLKCTHFQSLSHCVFCKKNPYYIIYARHWFNMMEVQQTQIVFNNILIISSKFFSNHSIYVKDNSYLIFSSKYIGYQKLDLWGFIS